MNWELIIPTLFSGIAVWVAIASKVQSKKAAEENLEIQKRMEVNQFYPIIDLDVKLEEGSVCLVINNRSDINSASSYTVKYILRVHAKNMNVDLAAEAAGKEIPSSSSEAIFPDELNEYLSDSLPFIKKTPEDNLHIVIRFWVQYKAAHPDSMPMAEDVVVFLTQKNGCLQLVNT